MILNRKQYEVTKEAAKRFRKEIARLEKEENEGPEKEYRLILLHACREQLKELADEMREWEIHRGGIDE